MARGTISRRATIIRPEPNPKPRHGGKVYHARIIYPLNTTIPDRKVAMVQLVTRMME